MPFPQELLSKHTTASKAENNRGTGGFKYKSDVPEGTRNSELISFVGHCTWYEIPINDAIYFAISYNKDCFKPPLPSSEVERVIKDGYSRYKENFFKSLFNSPMPEEPLFREDEELEFLEEADDYSEYLGSSKNNSKYSASGIDYSENNKTAETIQPWDKRRFTTAELLGAEIPETKWAIPNLIPEGLTILGGRPKVGKSWLALQMVHSVSTGGMFLGEKVDQGKCLYYALEDNAKRLQNRARTQGIPVEAEIVFLRDLSPLQGEGYSTLLIEIEEGNYKLIVIDTFAKAISGLDQNDQPKIGEVMNKLQKLAADKNVALVFVDHTSKNKGLPSDPINDIMNSTVKVAVADQILALYRENGKSGAVLKGRGREIEEIDMPLSWDKETCRGL